MEDMDQLYFELDEYLVRENSQDNSLATSFRSSCIAQTLQLIIKDGLECLEVYNLSFRLNLKMID